MEIAEGSNRAQRLPAEQNLVFDLKHKDKRSRFLSTLIVGKCWLDARIQILVEQLSEKKKKGSGDEPFLKGNNLSERTERALGTF